MTPTKEQYRMAMFMNLHPDAPETWPLETIDRLLDIEKNKGQRELHFELARMLSPRS